MSVLRDATSAPVHGIGLILRERTKIHRVTIIVIASALTLAIGFVVYRNVVGFCNSQGRYLDDAEMGNSSAIHQTVQPVVQIAPDGKSATIRARVLKVGGKAGELAGGTYEGRAINRDGIWKLQSLTLKQVWSSPFSQWMPVIERLRR